MSLPINPIILIPARLAASRLPGKPLAQIVGEPMIVHVWRRGQESTLGPTVVATEDEEIKRAVEAAGGRALLTGKHHQTGTDRIFEALEVLDPERRHDAIINLQGDVPTLSSDAIRAVFSTLADPSVDIATLAAAIVDPEERHDTSVVKIAVNFDPGQSRARAHYFSRAPIPWDGGDETRPLYHHIGIYAFRRAALERFVNLPRSPLETREGLEQLRALEANMRIDVALVDEAPLTVDTPDDLARARDIMSCLQPSERTLV